MCSLGRKSAFLPLLIIIGCSLLLCSLLPNRAFATAGTNPQLSFEGKVVNTGGTNIADGARNVEFKIYQDGTSSGSGSTLLWTEDWLVAGSSGVPSTGGVTFTGGTYQVNLGSICVLAGGTCGAKTNTGADFNQQTLWLSVQIGNTSSCTVTSSTTSFNTACGGDGEMTPFIRLTSTPYAFNTDKLDGIDSTAFGQLAANQTWTGTNTIALASATAFRVQNASFNVLSVDTSSNLVKVFDGTATQGYVGLSYSDGSSSGVITASAALLLNSTSTSAITLDSGTTGDVNIATGANAKIVTVGNQTGATALNLKSGSGNVNLSPSAGNDVVFSQGAGSQMQITASAAPTNDQVAVSNAGQGTSTTNADGLAITYETAGTTASADNAGLRIDVTSNNSGATTTLDGLKIGNLSSAEANSTETGLYVGTGWDIGLDLQSGGIQLAALASNPATPAAGNLRVYAKTIGGRTVLKILGPAGIDTPLQNALWANNTVLWSAGVAAGTIQGSAQGSVGTAAAVNPTTTNFYTMEKRSTYTAASSAANIQNGIRTDPMFYRGNTAGSGGFFAVFHFGTSTWTAGDRLFVGMSTGTTAVTTVNPSTLTNIAGIGIDAGDTAITFMHNDGSGTATKDTIAGQPTLASNQGYDLYIFMKPNDSTIYYRLDDTNASATIIDTSVSTDIVAVNTMLAAHVEMGTGTNVTASQSVVGINRIYVETDH